MNFPKLESVLLKVGNELCTKYTTDVTKATEKLSKVTFDIEANNMMYSVVLHLEHYWKFVEYGTKPHRPPFNAILKWVEVKPLIRRPLANGELPTDTQLAWMIVNKIEREGTDAQNTLQNTIQYIVDKYEEEIVNAFKEDIEDDVTKLLSIIY